MRDSIDTWRRWYKTARWQKLSVEIKVEALFTCVLCGRVGQGTHDTVADHRIPHRGDEALFWDRDNLQCLCKPCHDSTKQRDERRGATGGVV